MKAMLKVLLPLLLLALATPVLARPLVNLNLDLDRTVLPAGQTVKAIIKVLLDVPQLENSSLRPPVNLTLVLDRSGSMAGAKLQKAKEAAIVALSRLGAQDLFSLVTYDHSVITLIPPQSAANSEWITSRIRAITPGGNTALFGAVSQGAAEIRKHLDDNYIHRIILLSDGLANVGPSSASDLGRLGAALQKEGISVTTIGIGDGFNEDLMTQLASHSDGNHYFVESSQDLPRIFASELGDVLSVAASRIRIEIDCLPGVRPLRIIGREGTIRGTGVQLRMNQLYSGQQKYALIEVLIEPGIAGQQREIVQVTSRYENAMTNKAEKIQRLASINFSASHDEVRQSASRTVQKAVVENEMATARDRALDLYNAGRKEDAVRELQQSSDVLEASSANLGFSDLAQKAKSLNKDAVEFSAPSIPSARKKELRSESYQVRKQQKAH
ncbi:vWA domain-containing protein [Geopsychrobacter electrodiphilus]|uniref:vWA domain-containing protein n=1 Tax=Geopsychrobacter electrodiphilus TaxID=225196 RepID=UPI0003766076|nr:VWA domain-containing protein [Geopsychrobacter electrodiphilus]